MQDNVQLGSLLTGLEELRQEEAAYTRLGYGGQFNRSPSSPLDLEGNCDDPSHCGAMT